MKNKKKNCYDLGSFVQANQAGIGAAGQMGAGILEGFKNPNRANIGLGTAQGALSGAAAGAALGPLGMAGGALIGGVSGLVSGIQQKKAMDIQRDSTYGNLQGQALNGMSTANVNPYGTQIYALGGTIDPTKPSINTTGSKLSTKQIKTALKDVENKKQWMSEYVNSPKYNQRLQMMYNQELAINPNIHLNHEGIFTNNKKAKNSKQAANEVILKNNRNLAGTNITIGDQDLSTGAIGGYRSSYDELQLRDSVFTNPDYRNVTPHEMSHATNDGLSPYSFGYRDKKLAPIFKGFSEGGDSYLQDPSEVKARIDAVRYMLKEQGIYDAGTQDFTKEHYNQLKQNKNINSDFNFQQLESQFKGGDKSGNKMIFLMNNIASLGEDNTQKMANGADVQQNIINIEKGELQIDPNTGKILREFNGINPETAGLYKPHNKKGKDTSNNFVTAEPGTFIITKAKANKYKTAIENNDKLAQQTILQNIRNYKSEVKGDKLKFATGADVPVNLNPFLPNKYLGTSASGYGQVPVAPASPWGTPTFNPNVPIAPPSPLGDPNEVPYLGQVGLAPAGVINQKPFGIGNVQPTTLAGTTSYQSSGAVGNGFSSGLSKGLGAFAQYGPAAVNIARGLFGQVERENHITANQNPYLNQIQATMPQDVNMQPIYNDIYSQGRTATNDIRNNSNSSAVFRANRQNLGANTQRQISGARLQGDIANNQIRGQRGSIYAQLGEQSMRENARVQGYNAQIDQINSQNRGAKTQMLDKGIGQIGEIYQNNKYNNQMQNIDMFKAKLLPQIFTNLKHYQDIFGVDAINKLLKGQ